ncbi:hypothetical protein BMS3Bbin11_01869 [bacterium BMS3Bbin11]|nr:hypothetical protein BMS3Abin11_02532 [bacterium BMS3Abin11]GBE46768.1 hypothetical protein BMS3Bbin11_01869 [bacterium BMS3Bbin11]GMT41428.1 MAG: hypothetical protein IEMM0001_2163 [bacterium]
MFRVYSAQNSIDAHIVKGLLEQHGVSARIDGEYLQGGIGELPPMGLITVSVAEEDYDRALSLVSEYETKEL